MVGCLMYLKNKLAILLAAGVLLLLWNGALKGDTVHPTPYNHFYGDSNGDLTIAISDVNQMKDYILTLPYM